MGAHLEYIYRGRKDGNIIIKSNKQFLVPALSREIYDCEVSRDIGSIYIESDKYTTPKYISQTNALVQERAGVVPVEFKYYSTRDIYLKGRSRIGRWNDVISTIQFQSKTNMSPSLTNILEDLSIGKAEEEENEAIVMLISEYQYVFSEGEYDIGFCDKVKHTISVSDERPMRLQYRRIPPNQWSVVESYTFRSCNYSTSCTPYTVRRTVFMLKRNLERYGYVVIFED